MIDHSAENQTSQNIRRLAAEIVAAYVGANSVSASQLPELIRSVVTTLGGLESGAPEVSIEPPKPPVSIRRSVTPDYLVCLEDGKKLKMLKRHLRTTYNMSPKDYREKWGLPADYPMVAPSYAARRSEFAKKIGLGRKTSEVKKAGQAYEIFVERPFVIAQAGRLGLLIAVILYTASLRTAAASPPAAIEPFFGRYEGRTIVSGDDGDTTSRDLTVIIQPEGDRFRIEWTTVTRQSDGEIKRKTYSIGFEQTQRPKIFRSAMRTDMFGHHVPLDPLKGDPYVWCRIIGPVLTLYSLQITDIGGYDLQIYERTVEGDRMSLHFRRLHEGEPPKELTATLERVAGATGKGG